MPATKKRPSEERAVCAAGCGAELTGSRRKWCSDHCSKLGALAGRLAAAFNITPDEYDEIFAFQGGVCAVCERAPTATKRLAVDHSHRTGEVRGLLCNYCNLRVIGRSTSPSLHFRAYEYLERPPARAVLGTRLVPKRPPKRRTKRRRPRTS